MQLSIHSKGYELVPRKINNPESFRGSNPWTIIFFHILHPKC